MSEMRVVASGLRFPEGPVSMRDGSIILVEIERRTVSRVAPDGTVTVVAETGGGPNGSGDRPGRRALCLQQRRVPVAHGDKAILRPVLPALDYKGGRIERVDLGDRRNPRNHSTTAAARRALNGPNDIVFDAPGGFYFTDLGKSRERDRDNGGSITRPRRLPIVQVTIRFTPNGIGLSPDGKTLYVAETETAPALGLRDRRPRGHPEAAVSLAAWRPSGARDRRPCALRQPGGGRRGQRLCRHPVTGCITRLLAGRAHQAARRVTATCSRPTSASADPTCGRPTSPCPGAASWSRSLGRKLGCGSPTRHDWAPRWAPDQRPRGRSCGPWFPRPPGSPAPCVRRSGA